MVDSNSLADSSSTQGADRDIIFGSEPAYISKSADTFFQCLRNQFQTIPIIEAGQSLGGATSDGVVADHPGDNNLSAITFNALPYGQSIPDLTTAAATRLATLPSPADPGLTLMTNYYVGNEIATQAQIVQGVLQLFGGTPIGDTVDLPDLPEVSDPSQHYKGLPAPIVIIYDAPAAVSQLFQALYSPSSANYGAAAQWLREVYPSGSLPVLIVPLQIQAVLAGASVPADTDAETIIQNLDNSVILLNGSFTSPQQVETIFRSEAAVGDTYTVQQLPLTPGTRRLPPGRQTPTTPTRNLLGLPRLRSIRMVASLTTYIARAECYKLSTAHQLQEDHLSKPIRPMEQVSTR